MMLHVLMLMLFSGVLTEVLQDFTMCKESFARGNPPTVFNAAQNTKRLQIICQKLGNVYHYATLYDTHNRIPVYSAYKFSRQPNCERKNGNWFIEPQLDDDNGGPEMATEGSVTNGLRGEHQALKSDYEGSRLDKGHLVPVYHASSQSCADATFTLTNAAPQSIILNRGSWRKIEYNMAQMLTNSCPDNAYIVTGVRPSRDRFLPYPNGKRVNVPTYFWSAYCCLDQNQRCEPSGAYIGYQNGRKRSIEITRLEAFLTNSAIPVLKIF